MTVPKCIIVRVLRNGVRNYGVDYAEFLHVSTNVIHNRSRTLHAMTRSAEWRGESTTRRQANGSAVHHLVLCIIGQWTHSLGNGPGFDLFPTIWRSVDWQSARQAPVQLISVPATPVHGHIKCIIVHHPHLLYNSGYYTHHMLSHSEILHFTNECVCVCVLHDPQNKQK
jgi:hypothetical protein